MPLFKRERPANALKHGAFSRTVIFPGESRAEFQALHDALIREWDPQGPLEQDAILTIAKYLFRKTRLGIFRRAEEGRAIFGSVFDKETPLERDVEMLKISGVESERLEVAQKFFRENADKLKELEQQMADYARAVGQQRRDILEDALADGDLYDLAEMKELATVEGYMRLVELEARLDTMIDKAFKRLVQLKAMKETLNLKPIKSVESSGSSGSVVPLKRPSSEQE